MVGPDYMSVNQLVDVLSTEKYFWKKPLFTCFNNDLAPGRECLRDSSGNLFGVNAYDETPIKERLRSHKFPLISTHENCRTYLESREVECRRGLSLCKPNNFVSRHIANDCTYTVFPKR